MSQTWNQHVVKKENKALVLETIKEKAPISRASIAQVTGLNKGTVSSLVSELIDEKLTNESGTGESSGGRRPVMLLLNETAGYTISIDLGVKSILGVLTDLRGNILHEKRTLFNNNNVEEVLHLLYKLIDELGVAAPDSEYGIVGIGVGVPGGVVTTEGEILLAPNLGWKKVPLSQLLSEKYQVPITVENEANAGAYGEKVYGVGQLSSELVYASVGIGIGVGLILDGKLYRGLRGFSGELGHMTIEKDGAVCRCGNKGCWELYASEQALLKQAEKNGYVNATVEEIVIAANNGEANAINMLAQLGDYLGGVGITNIIHIFNPEQVVMGNTLQSAEKFIMPAIEKRIENNAIGFNKNDVQLNMSKLKKHSTVMGMAAFTIESFYITRGNERVTIS
ncbi:xylose-responsive transcription regulator [Gracilibacillus boraciitolerans JCM 21714]|uniref:Xylose-responsive transcription regulator n=1 Tax=Gracilibacillus boraciitolerans JCM 21714 TaxID=1298598 RepID=W4VGP0_9BACI|nr:ROK family protein [Gracilibacillus boraciitolerans]GAE91973.1 xylose-responsive transcription regulator [Gracilibacillus boraciitolerans JCM 21714]